jgi:hypothetical protein
MVYLQFFYSKFGRDRLQDPGLGLIFVAHCFSLAQSKMMTRVCPISIICPGISCSQKSKVW